MNTKRLTTELHIIRFMQVGIVAFIATITSELNNDVKNWPLILVLIALAVVMAIFMIVWYATIHNKTGTKSKSKH